MEQGGGRMIKCLNDQTPQCQKVVKDNMWPAYR
jgi:hypothetical protein